ncbi:Transposase-associated domain [Arabidopsis thaliana x Arabidopsis arenosa]|uniref:Transposase-associated domain n=1 Tax=Arabidopsis thaliana x Arabidopsis arenosa TaxID=1240361 RepID=A0A8T1ZLF4_9BRAS|nr:Transposase-associated domain [Arabidopsis thaliana x Arabidopsis arenosa]
MSNFYESREWMYKRFDYEHNCVYDEFVDGINIFVDFARNQASYIERGDMLCPCTRCKNLNRHDAKTVAHHLYMKGFTANYFVWTNHGENCYFDNGASTSHYAGEPEAWRDHSNIQVPVDQYHVPDADIHMVPDDVHIPENIHEPFYEELNHDGTFQALEAANQPLYEGCVDGISQLYLSSKVMHWKTNFNVSEECLDDISQTFKTVLPSPNKAPKSYYETKKIDTK